MSRERMEPDWLFMSTRPRTVDLPDRPTCSYSDDDCRRSPYEDGLCKLHYEVVAYRRERARAHPHVCTCIAGDGTEHCPRYEDCLDAWSEGRLVRL